MCIAIKNEKIYENIVRITQLNDKFDEIEPIIEGAGITLFGKEIFTQLDIELFNKYYKKFPKKFNLENESRKYRYFYSKIWESNKPILYFLLLNPSTTNGEHMDPTVTNCYKLAREKYGSSYGGFAIINLFALRSPKPQILNELIKNNDIDIKTNLLFLEELFKEGDKDIVLAWGLDKKYSTEKETVKAIIENNNLYTLKESEERHPSNQAWSRLNPNGFKAASLCKYHF